MTQHHEDLKELLENLDTIEGELGWLSNHAEHAGSTDKRYQQGFEDGMSDAYRESADMLHTPIHELKRILALIAEDAAYQALQQPVPPSAGQLPLFDESTT
jgi:hypothetical protein